MTAALHLAEVHQAPPSPKRKRKGGGSSGPEFYEYAELIYADDRADAGARSLLLALAYAVVTVPEDGPAQWDLVQQALGKDPTLLASLINADAPRYVSPLFIPSSYDNLLRVCSAPRIRPYRSDHSGLVSILDGDDAADEKDFRNKLKICGARAKDFVVEKQPGTGWHRLHYFCPSHRSHLDRVREQVAAQNEVAPEPIPTAGGLLPSYFEADWEPIYRHYRSHWNPPAYGLCADDWPLPGREPVAPRARLRLAALDGELLGGGA